MAARHFKLGACKTCGSHKKLCQSKKTQCSICYIKEKYPTGICNLCNKTVRLQCNAGTTCQPCWQETRYKSGNCVTCRGYKILRYKKGTQCFTCRFERSRYKGDVTTVSAKTGTCEICLVREISDVDHDHTTMIVRSKLCHVCNKALGMFRDDPAVMRRAASYVDYHRSLTVPLDTSSNQS